MRFPAVRPATEFDFKHGRSLWQVQVALLYKLETTLALVGCSKQKDDELLSRAQNGLASRELKYMH